MMFNIMSFPTFWQPFQKFSLSQARERIVIGAMLKRGQDTTSSDGSPVAKARPTNLVMHSQCTEEVSPQSWGSLVNLEKDDQRKRVCLAAGNWRHSDSNFDVGHSHVNRQEKANLAQRKLGQKDQTRAKSEEYSSSTRKLGPSLPK